LGTRRGGPTIVVQNYCVVSVGCIGREIYALISLTDHQEYALTIAHWLVVVRCLEHLLRLLAGGQLLALVLIQVRLHLQVPVAQRPVVTGH